MRTWRRSSPRMPPCPHGPLLERTRRQGGALTQANWTSRWTTGGTVALLFLAVALLVAPSAGAAPSFTAGFSGGKLGGATALHFRFVDPPDAGTLPEPAFPIIITMPAGTKLLRKAPLGAFCNIKVAQRTSGAGCPKQSHFGPSSSVRWAAVVGGKVVERTVKLTPVLTRGGVSLLGPAAPPFLATEMLLKWSPLSLTGSSTQGLIFDTGVGAVGPAPPDGSTTFDTILEVSFTLSGVLRDRHGQHPVVTMPASCPASGFPWAVTVGGAAVVHLEATSPCP
jgi:hypothetical protein